MAAGDTTVGSTPPWDACVSHSCPSRGAGGSGRETPGPAVAETLRIPGAGAVCNIDQRPCLGGLPTRQRAWSCRCVCSRESSCRNGLFWRQARLRSIQSLNLALLIHTEHQGLLRRIQIQSDHVGQLLQKASIPRQFEALHPVRLEIVTAPDVTDGGLADVLVFGHQAATPLRHPFWLGLKRRIDNGL